VPGKPYQSKLKQFESEVFELLDAGCSYRKAAVELNRRHGLGITHNAVFSYVRSRRPARGKQLFYDGLSPDIREQLLKRIAAEWTHDSTAIEGNTLSLGETVKILELGLTISGKSLREHEEVHGHARAIDLIYEMIPRTKLTSEDLFALHRTVMPKVPIDALRPVGAWKRDFNGTTGVANGKTLYMEYAAPQDVPRLMEKWLRMFSRLRPTVGRSKQALSAFTRLHMVFVRIHPFFDGNGRVARLVCNLPMLRTGFPPVIVPEERRGDYIDLLWEYQYATGTIRRTSELLPEHPSIRKFENLLMESWDKTVRLVDEARQREKERKRTNKTK